MTEEIGDFFGGGEGGPAAISLKYARPGESWEGVLLPPVGSTDMNSVAYRTTQQSDIEGNLLFWDDGKKRLQAEIVALTEYGNKEFLSEKAKERLNTSEAKDDGIRRQFIKGSRKIDGSSAKEFGEALRKAGVTKPEVGAWVKQTFVKPVDIGGGKEGKYVTWEYKRPTDASKAKVKAYLDALASIEDRAEDDEPPF